jgi:hypothetical protein
MVIATVLQVVEATLREGSGGVMYVNVTYEMIVTCYGVMATLRRYSSYGGYVDVTCSRYVRRITPTL